MVKLSKDLEISLTSIFSVDDTAEISLVDANKYRITWKLYAVLNDASDETLNKITFNQNVSYQKIIHFIKNYIDNAIWYDVPGNRMMATHFASSENVFIITPTLTLPALTACLFAKLNSLCKDGIFVSDVIIKDLTSDISYEYNDDDAEVPVILPTQEEFMGSLSIYTAPWWLRDDLLTYDNCAIDEDELAKIKDTLIQYDEKVKQDFKDIENEVSNALNMTDEAEIIEIDFKSQNSDGWKPKIV